MSQLTNNSAILIDLFHQLEDSFFKSLSLKYQNFGNTAFAYFTGVNEAGLNPVFIRKDNFEINEILEKCGKFYNEDKPSFAIVIPQQAVTDSIKINLNKAGFTGEEKSVTMMIDLNNHEFANKIDFDIRLAKDHLDEWIIPVTEAFEGTSKTVSQYVTAHTRALAKHGNFQHLTLYINNNPVSSLTLLMYKNQVRIDDVSTLPTCQNNGYATHLVNYALLLAARSATTYAFLDSNETGLALYQKIGFKPLFTYANYFAPQ